MINNDVKNLSPFHPYEGVDFSNTDLSSLDSLCSFAPPFRIESVKATTSKPFKDSMEKISEHQSPLLNPFLESMEKVSSHLHELAEVSHQNKVIEDFLLLIAKVEDEVVRNVNLGILTADIVASATALIVLGAKLALLEDISKFETINEISEIFSVGLTSGAHEVIECLMEFHVVPHLAALVSTADVLGVVGGLLCSAFCSYRFVKHDILPSIQLEKIITVTQRELDFYKSHGQNLAVTTMLETRSYCLKNIGRVNAVMGCFSGMASTLCAPLRVVLLACGLTGIGNILNAKLFGPLYVACITPKLAEKGVRHWNIYLGSLKTIASAFKRNWTLKKLSRRIKEIKSEKEGDLSEVHKLFELDKKIRDTRRKAHQKHLAWVMGTTIEQIEEFKQIIGRMLQENDPDTGLSNHRAFSNFFAEKEGLEFDVNPVEAIFSYMFPLKEIFLDK